MFVVRALKKNKEKAMKELHQSIIIIKLSVYFQANGIIVFIWQKI